MPENKEKTIIYQTNDSNTEGPYYSKYYKNCDKKTLELTDEIEYNPELHDVEICKPPPNPDHYDNIDQNRIQGGRRRRKSKKSKKAKKTKKSRKGRKSRKSRKH